MTAQITDTIGTAENADPARPPRLPARWRRPGAGAHHRGTGRRDRARPAPARRPRGRLREAGCFRMAVPHSHGGDGASLPEYMRLVRDMSRVDGSVGWTIMIGSSAPVILGHLPPDTFDAVYASGPDVALAGSFNPTGVATPTDGGYRVSGRWAFASGCQHADWFAVHCMVDDGRLPPLRMMVVPPGDVDILDTWWVSGLCGTGSHDVSSTPSSCPSATRSASSRRAPLPGPVGRIPEISVVVTRLRQRGTRHRGRRPRRDHHVGLWQGADAAASTLAGNPLFRYRLGETDTLLRAATALLDSEVSSAWAAASAGEEFTPQRRARIRARRCG